MLEGEGHRIAATSATVTGESDVFYVNSKLRLGFELAVKLKWSGTFDGEEVSGDLEVPDLDSSMDSFDVKAKVMLGPKVSDVAVEPVLFSRVVRCVSLAIFTTFFFFVRNTQC